MKQKLLKINSTIRYAFLIMLALVLMSETLKAQAVVNMGSVASVSTRTGSFYDDGGPTGLYSNSANQTLLIFIPGADSIRITFTSYVTEAAWDYMQIYQGNSIAGTVLTPTSGGGGSSGFGPGLNGNVAAPFTYVAAGNSMFIRFRSDGSVNDAGWAATWSAVFPPSYNNIGAISIDTPYTPCAGTYPVDATISNFGQNQVTAATVYWSVNGSIQTPYTFSGLLDTANGAGASNIRVNLGNYAFAAGVNNLIRVWTGMPNGSFDTVPSNDSTSRSIIAAMSGTYTIGGSAGPNNFATFAAATSALQYSGVCGPVVFQIAPGTYNEQVTLTGPIAGSSAANTITFDGVDKTNRIVNYASTNANLPHTFAVIGCQYIRVRNLTIRANGNIPGNYGYAFHIRGSGNNNIHVKNCNLEVVGADADISTSTNYIPMLISGNNFYYTNVKADNIEVDSNYIYNGYFGICFYGNTSAPFSTTSQFRNNQVIGTYYYGLYMYYAGNPQLHNNNIVLRSSASTGAYGIYYYYNMPSIGETANITGNRIPRFGSNGIYIYSANPVGTKGLLANNMIGGQQLSATGYGIYMTSSTRWMVYNNSVNMNMAGSTNIIYAGLNVQSSCSGISVINNSFARTASGTGAAFYGASSAIFDTMNYNNFFKTDTAGLIFLGANYNPSNFRGIGGHNNNSLNNNPAFTTAINLDLTNGCNNGTSLPLITTDINGVTRNSPPDIGADEFPSANNDIGIQAILSPTSPMTLGAQDLVVRMVNTGANAVTSADISYVHNGGTAVTQAWTGNLAPCDTISIVFTGTQQVTLGNANNIVVYTSAPNTSTDSNPINDTLVGGFYTPLVGNYTIGGSGANFSTITAAVNTLFSAGISGPVNFAINPGTYTERVVLSGTITGLNASNPILFEGVNKATTIITENVTSAPLVMISGLKYISFRNMTMINTSPAGAVFGVIGTTTNNNGTGCNLTNCILSMPNAGASTSYNVVYTGTATGFGVAAMRIDSVSIDSNVITNGYYGISVYGATNASYNRNIKIRNNVVNNAYYMGAYVAYNYNPLEFTNNTISVNSAYGYYGAYFYSNQNSNTTLRTKFSNNRITNFSGYGAYLYLPMASSTAAPLECYNNMLNGGTTYNGPNYGLNVQLPTNATAYIMHNTVRTNYPVTTNTYAAFYYSGSTNGVIRNNIFGSTATTVAPAAYFNTNPAAGRVNHNIYYNTASTLLVYRNGTYYSPANYKTAAAGGDSSFNVVPSFASSTDLHNANACSPRGADLLSFVSTDIDGDARSTAPMVGADEIVSISNDMEVVSIVSPAVPVTLGAQDVVILVRNAGGNTVSSFNLVYRHNNGTPVTMAYSGAGLAPCDTLTMVFTGAQQITLGAGASTLKVYTSSPNAVTDANRINDTANASFAAPLNGNYVVGAAPSDFTTINDAITALSQRGITGPVTLNLKSGSFNESVILPAVTGMSATNNVTIKSQANNRDSAEITYNSGTGNQFVVRLNGSNYSLKNLTIRQQNGAVTCYGLMYQGSASYDTVDNCKIMVPIYNTVGTGGTYTIFANGIDGSGLTFTNNRFEGSYYGVYWYGNSSTRVKYTTFDNNQFENSFYSPFYYMYYTRFTRFTNNVLNTATPIANTTNYLYWYYNDSGSVYTNNRLNSTGGITTYWYNYYAINSPALPSVIANNTINSGDGIFWWYFGNSVTSNRYVYNNSMNLGGGQFYVANSGLTNFRVFNNIIQSNGGNTYCYYISATPTSPAMASDYNLINTTTGTTPIYAGAARTLTAHKLASPLFEQNSVGVRAPFMSATNLTPNPADTNVWMINGRGTHLAEVTTDINNTTRPANVTLGAPDLGAIEVTPNTGVLAPMAVASPASPVAGITQSFVTGFDTVAKITWDGSSPVPTDITVRYYSGVTANIQGTSGKAANSYLNISSNGGGGYLYTLDQYYKQPLIGNISNETNMRSAHKVGSSWTANIATASTPDTVKNILTTTNMSVGNASYSATDDTDPITTFLTINTQPVNTSKCAGDSNMFIVDATGTNITYQWQVNTGSGFTNVVSPSATNDTLTVSGITAGMNGYQYRCAIGSISGTANSNIAILTVNPSTAINSHPSNVALCAGANASFSVSASGSGITYQWEENSGSGFTPIPGAVSATLGRSLVNIGMTGFQYRCVVTGACGVLTSNAATLTVNSILTVNTQPVANITTCAGTNVMFFVGATGVANYQWQVSTGAGYTNISGANDDTLSIASLASMNGNLYRCAMTGGCGIAVSNAGQLYVEYPGQWKGTVSTSWTATGNWGCGQLPTGTTNVVVASTAPNMPLITTNQPVNNLTIDAGATLTLNTSTARLAINGSLTNNGTIINTGGVVSMSGSTPQTINGGTFTKLEINNPAGVTLTGNVTFTDTLTLAAGKITMGNFNMTLSATGAISGYNSSRYLVTNGTGKLNIQNIGTGGRTGAVVFPVGPDATNYNPVSLTNSGTADDYSVNAYNGVYGTMSGSTPQGAALTNNAVGATWNINELTPGGSNVTVTLQWNGSQELPGFNRTSSYISHHDGSIWNAASPSSATGTNPYTQTRSGLTSFSPFAIGSNGALPVEFSMFNAMASGTSAIVSWTTASEVNNDYFIVERSSDNKNFSAIGKVEGAGSSSITNNYIFTDNEAIIAASANKTVYYRLTQVDRDGASTSTGSVAVTFGVSGTGVSVQPNPFNESFTVTFANNGLNQIKVTDITGKVLVEKSARIATTITELSQAKPGMYFIYVNNSTEVIKVIKY